MENQVKDQMAVTETTQVKHARKRYMILAALILCCIALVTGGTLAYFTAEETAYNVITTGELSMELKEETTGGKPFPEGGITGIVPGQSVDKKVYVVNNGGVDFYVRITVNKAVTGADGEELPFEHITLDLNTADWTEKDGYYYYNRVLKSGEKTTPLFNTVTFETSMDSTYMEATVNITVNAQAVQSRNNGTSALDATGWAAE